MRMSRTKPTPKIHPERCDSKAIIASMDSEVIKTLPIGSSLTRPTTPLSFERVSNPSTPHVARERQLRGVFVDCEAFGRDSIAAGCHSTLEPPEGSKLVALGAPSAEVAGA